MAHYVGLELGFELARSVLSLLRPPEAMQECFRLYKEDAEVERRRTAVELLRVVADASVLPWIDDFLDDDDPEVRLWGVGVLDYLVFRDLVDGHEDAVHALLGRIASADDEGVRQTGERIAAMLAEDDAPL